VTAAGGAWTCPDCGAPFANANASHSCVRIDVAERFAGASPEVRGAFDRLVALASSDGPVTVVAQKTRLVLAAPMRFVAVQVHGDWLGGHVLADRAAPHPVVTEIVPDAYGSGLYLHRLSIHSAVELDDLFAAFVREAAARVGRRERLAARLAAHAGPPASRCQGQLRR
jgi:hypothetical protein